jgi:hypothetical protein
MIPNIPMIESWEALPEDSIFTNQKNVIIGPVSKFFGVQSKDLDYFVVRPKKCYNSQELRDHDCKVLNYFEKYFDPDKELMSCMFKIKYMMDIYKGTYRRDNFDYDVRSYILSDSIKKKVIIMSEYNYSLHLTYKNITPALQYDDNHAKILLEMSILMNFVIPLITHFANNNRIGSIDDFIMDIFDIILNMFPVNIFGKLYETSISNVGKSEYKNATLWGIQDIRGKNVVTHSRDSVDNIILNIMPKYSYDRNIIALKFRAAL